MSAAPQGDRGSRGALWISLAIAGLGFVLRLWHLTDWDFWTDEIHTLTISSTGEWSFGPAYITAPLNFILTGWSIGAFGLNELGGRFVPFVAGVVTVWLVYDFGRHWIGPRAAILAELVVALSMWHVYWSQNARYFSLQVLFILVGLHAFLSYWKGGNSKALWFVPIAFIGALAVHSSSVFFLAAALVFVCGSAAVDLLGLREGPRRIDARHWRAFAALAVAMVIFIPVSIWVGRYLVDTVVPWNPLWNLLGSIVFYVPPYLALAALAGSVVLYLERNDLGVFLMTMVLVPIALLVVASRVTIAGGSYVVAMVIPVAWLTGAAFDRLLDHGNVARWTAAILAGGLFFSQLGDLALYHTEYRGLKPRWHEAADFIAANRQPGDVVAAPEPDVIAQYIGWGGLYWFSAVEQRIADGTFPPDGTRGVWYVVYTADRALIQNDEDAREHALSTATFRALLPLHYGPKDRTLGVFYQPIEETDDADGS